MEKKNKPLSSASANKINPLQISEDGPSHLVGSIIEKGDLENPNSNLLPPQVTVLPFPVARHRSHGPHWNPVRVKNTSADNNDDEDHEDSDPTDFNRISAFANPVQRKQKRGLNTRQWKEYVSSDNLSETDISANKPSLKKTGRQQKGEVAIENAIYDETKMELDTQDLSSVIPSNKVGDSLVNNMDSQSLTSGDDIEMHDATTSSLFKLDRESTERSSNGVMVSSSNLNNFGDRQASMSLEDEIDNENRARLDNMSPEEIAEAQAEITEKMNPALLNLLKVRGLKKLKQQNISTSGEVSNGELYPGPTSENQSGKKSNASSHLGSENSETMEKIAKNSMNEPNKDSMQSGGNLWNSWSERVEAVRKLRFSLEGSIITDNAELGGMSCDNGDVAINASERDFLRTDGDPASIGYTIKEAVQLTRSVIPGQRVIALHLLESVLDNAMSSMQQKQVGSFVKNADLPDKSTDWEAIWAYCLGPEPELVLSLRMCLDDNHSSVILACTKVIQSALSCKSNDNFFDISDKISLYETSIFTGPVFRSKPEMDDGFLQGGFWKYNAKPSNILTFPEDAADDGTEGTHTIQDDIVLAGQDFAAGLVRMGILHRMHYLLEGDLNAALEECIVSILVAIARHSPTCANTIMNFPGLVNLLVHKFTTGDSENIHSKIKSVTLLKVLAQSEKKNCAEFIQNGSFLAMTQHLFRYASSLDRWIKSGEESCKLLSALMVEQLRFWRVCISYGFCVSCYSDIFPALCLWLNPPTFEKLLDNNLLISFLSLSREAYIVLEALARKLPAFYSQNKSSDRVSNSAIDGLEMWSWSFVPPLIDIALKWIALKKDHFVSQYFQRRKGTKSDDILRDLSSTSFFWVFSAIMHLLAALLERVNPEETLRSCGKVPWLPEFVPKIGLAIVENQYLSVNSSEKQYHLDKDHTFIGDLICLRQRNSDESSLASVSCLHGFLRLITSTDNLISMAKKSLPTPPNERRDFSTEGIILEDGLLKRSLFQWTSLLNVLMKLVGSEWYDIQNIETFSRGGPAPGAGLGWGASNGGFWSINALLAQADASLLVYLLQVLQLPSGTEITTSLNQVNSLLQACLIMGPRDRIMIEKALDILFQVPVFNCLNLCVQQYLQSSVKAKPLRLEYTIDDFSIFCNTLASHFKNRWLSVKKKSRPANENVSRKNKSFNKGSVALDTIHEDSDNRSSLTKEWAHQRLPLPMHWFLSPIHDFLEVAKGGLFFLLAIEAMSFFLSTDFDSPSKNVPLVRKLHSLSVILLSGMDVLDDSKSRDLYEALQDVYGKLLDEARVTKPSLECLRFQSEIHESYSTFLETLVEEFSSVSYGDVVFGRQVLMYLHRCTEAPARLAAWKALSNACVLEILPPLEKCLAQAEGYLEPVEDDEGILEAYAKSWTCGALDRAATRRTMAYTLVVHHLSSFIFAVDSQDKISLRNKLVKSLLRDYSQKPKREGMMLELIQYCKPSASLQFSDIESRFELLAKACDHNSMLLGEVEKLRSGFANKNLNL